MAAAAAAAVIIVRVLRLFEGTETLDAPHCAAEPARLCAVAVTPPLHAPRDRTITRRNRRTVQRCDRSRVGTTSRR